nr:acyl-coenzyme A thioesterase 13-like [Ipomoea batatas]
MLSGGGIAFGFLLQQSNTDIVGVESGNREAKSEEMGGKDAMATTPGLLNSTTTKISADLSPNSLHRLDGFLRSMGVYWTSFPSQHQAKDSFSHLTRGILKVQHIHPGKLTCLLVVKPAITNAFGGMHGGAVGSIAERVAIACARTVAGKDKELFLGELSMSYLSAATVNAEVLVHGSVIRSGRNLTVVAMEFRLKDSEKLVYISRATLYHTPVASL